MLHLVRKSHNLLKQERTTGKDMDESEHERQCIGYTGKDQTFKIKDLKVLNDKIISSYCVFLY